MNPTPDWQVDLLTIHVDEMEAYYKPLTQLRKARGFGALDAITEGDTVTFNSYAFPKVNRYV